MIFWVFDNMGLEVNTVLSNGFWHDTSNKVCPVSVSLLLCKAQIFEKQAFMFIKCIVNVNHHYAKCIEVHGQFCENLLYIFVKHYWVYE